MFSQKFISCFLQFVSLIFPPLFLSLNGWKIFIIKVRTFGIRNWWKDLSELKITLGYFVIKGEKDESRIENSIKNDRMAKVPVHETSKIIVELQISSSESESLVPWTQFKRLALLPPIFCLPLIKEHYYLLDGAIGYPSALDFCNSSVWNIQF